jgi:hypothetical protein
MMERINPDDVDETEQDIAAESMSELRSTVTDTYTAVCALQVTVTVVLRLLRHLVFALVLVMLGATLASLL